MPHVVSRPNGPFALGGIQVHQVPVGDDNLVWVLVRDGRAAVVDGPADAGPVLALCEQVGARLEAVLNTHTHGDHVGINRDLERRGLLSGLRVVGPAGARADVPGLTEPVDEGDRVELFGEVAEVWRTDGHLNGHVSFVFRPEVGPGAVFCGDTLFAGGCGYLFDGPPSAMLGSLLRLAGLPGDTLVCCAHEYTTDNLLFARFVEPRNRALSARADAVAAIRASGGCAVPSTIGEEQATNPFLRPGSPALIARVHELHGPTDGTPLGVFTATRQLKDRKLHRAWTPEAP